MFALKVVQAAYGDSLIVQAGEAGGLTSVLVDGGPPGVFADHLKAELGRLAGDGGSLALVVLSHVDQDHVAGLLDLTSELLEDDADGRPRLIAIGGLWHNSFQQTTDPDGGLQIGIEGLLATGGAPEAMARTGLMLLSIADGDRLRVDAMSLGLPRNEGFAGGLICVDDAPAPVPVGDLTLRVVGPTRADLDALQADWQKWLDEHEEDVGNGYPAAFAAADGSVPNLSSIALLAEAEGKRILLSGDGLGEHLMRGLEAAGQLTPDGGMHVDVFKVAHHGSVRNATPELFRRVIADKYVLCANGRDGNPDPDTLDWIVAAAQEQGRSIELVATTMTDSLKALVAKSPPGECGYRLTVMAEGADAMEVSPVVAS